MSLYEYIFDAVTKTVRRGALAPPKPPTAGLPDQFCNRLFGRSIQWIQATFACRPECHSFAQKVCGPFGLDANEECDHEDAQWRRETFGRRFRQGSVDRPAGDQSSSNRTRYRQRAGCDDCDDRLGRASCKFVLVNQNGSIAPHRPPDVNLRCIGRPGNSRDMKRLSGCFRLGYLLVPTTA